MILHPDIIVTPDQPIVRLREPREKVDLPAMLNNVLRAQGWGIGTHFYVQFLNHERNRLLSEALFVVHEIDESLQTSEANPYQPVTRNVISHKCRQLGEWWQAEAPIFPAGTVTTVEHKGFGNYAVVANGEEICLISKQEGGKERAERIAAGAEPLPEQAA